MNIITPDINHTFTKDDIINLDACKLDAYETTVRMYEREQKTGQKRTLEKLFEDVFRGLVMEYYMLQINSSDVCKKATDINPKDIYHDIVEVATGIIHECKTKENLSEQLLEDFRIQRDINRILTQGWNKSNYMHVCEYINGTYIYKGWILLREPEN